MINKAILLGNTGKDPEIKTTSAGKKVATFSLATSENHKGSGGEKITNTSWHNIVAWTPLAEIAEQYIKKGQMLYIEGRINYRSYEDKNGVTKYITEIVAGNIQMIGGKKQDDIAIRPEPQATDRKDAGQKKIDDDLPFN